EARDALRLGEGGRSGRAPAAAPGEVAARDRRPPAAGRQPAARYLVLVEPRHRPRPADARPLGGRTTFRPQIDRRDFGVPAEMPVIEGGGMAEVTRQLDFMAEYLDAVNATDNAAAHAHASPLAVALAIQRYGVEPIMQLVCRDRNRLALEADLVGASLHGIENVCCLTGDDVTAGDEPEARRVFDL